MSEVPGVKRLVMFRHGVAYVERSGPAEGAFEMSFKRDEMNDVLKSMSVWVASGEGRVGAVAFEAPDDPREALRERNLSLSPLHVARDLIAALGGRAVSVVSDAGAEAVRGEVIGIEEVPSHLKDVPARRQLVLRTGAGEITLVDLESVRKLSLQEAPSRADLAYLIDRTRASSAGTARIVNVQLAGRADDLRIAYVIPAPVWRVSYRLAVEDETAVLMAWAIVHNPVDEDLLDIQLTLTTGQPVSFEIDLYEAKRVRRARVEEKSRAVAAPTSFERAPRKRKVPPPARAMAPSPAPPPMAAPVAVAAGAAIMPEIAAEEGYGDSMLDGILEMGGDASGEDRGELFEYRMDSAVSLKRGGSAMVPLATTKPKARKERIWRVGRLANPDLVLTFDNDTGLVLEEGPLVVYDEGSYAGEAMLPYSARGAEVRLAFAKDLAVRCKHSTKTTGELSGITLGDRVLMQEHRSSIRHTLRADSDHDKEVELIFELVKVHGRTLSDDTPKPLEETASFRRFKVAVPAHGHVELEVKEQWVHHQHVQYRTLSAVQLADWLSSRFLDKRTFEELSEVLQAWHEAAQLDAERSVVNNAMQAAFQKQSKLSEQLGVLRDSGDEGRLRLRYVKELGDAQTKVNDYEDQIATLQKKAAALRAQAERRLKELTEES